MGKVTATVVEQAPSAPAEAQGAASSKVDASAEGKQPVQHMIEASISKELKFLQSRFNAYKRDGESGDHSMISTELLMDVATQAAATDLYQDKPKRKQRGAKGTAKQSDGHLLQLLDAQKSAKSCQVNHELFQIHVENKMRTGTIETDDFWEETNLSTNVDSRGIESLMAEKYLFLANEEIKQGHKMPESHLDLLKRFSKSTDNSEGSVGGAISNPSVFERYFHISEQSQRESNEFKKLCVKQIHTLYSIYMQRQKLSEEQKKDFFDYISSFLNIPKDDTVYPKSDKELRRNTGVMEARTQICLDTGMNFSIELLKKLGQSNLEIMNCSLQGLQKTLSQYRPGALYSAVDRMGYQIDDNLNQAREQLVSMFLGIVESKKELTMPEKEFLSVSINLLLTLGIIRSNVEDYLTVIALLAKASQDQEKFKFIDLSEQIKLIHKFYGFYNRKELAVKSEPDKDQATSAVNKESSQPQSFQIGQINMLTTIPIKMNFHSGDLVFVKGSQRDKMVADDDHFYFFKNQPDKGIFTGLYKVTQAAQMQNSRGASYRMAGKNLKQNTSKLFSTRSSQGLDSQMFILDGKIFIKYEAPEQENRETQDSKKQNASSVRIETDKKADDSNTDEALASHLVAFDANTLETIQEIKLESKPKDKEQKQEQLETESQTTQQTSLKGDSQIEQPQQIQVAKPITISLDHVASWTHTKQYRNQELSYEQMPMITDGQQLYVFARNKSKRPDGQSEKPSIVINIYTIEKSKDNKHDLPSFTYSRQITLIWKESEAFHKDDNSEKFVGQMAQWATNGQVLLCFARPSRVYWFDIMTGKLLGEKPLSSEYRDYTLIHYNYKLNQFIKMQTRDHNSECNEYWIFNFANLKVLNRESNNSDQLNALRLQLQSQSENEEPKNGFQSKNLIKSIMKKPKKTKAQNEVQIKAKEAWSLDSQRMLILDFINQFTLEKFYLFYEEVRNKSQQNQSADDVLHLFKYQNCTYLTENSFILIADNLFSLRNLVSASDVEGISGSQKSVSQQYSLLFMLNMLRANFKALSHCQIKLSFLLDNELDGLPAEEQTRIQNELSQNSEKFWQSSGQHLDKGYNYFMSVYEAVIVAVVEKASHQSKLAAIEDVKVRDELTQVWQQIVSVCKEIIDESVNLLHQDPQSMIQIVLAALSKPKNEISFQNICVQISYLNLKDNMRKVIDKPEIHALSQQIFELFSDQILNAYREPLTENVDKSKKLVELTTRDFILNYTQLLLQKYCETQEGLAKMHKKVHQAEVVDGQKQSASDGEPASPCVLNKYESHLIQTIELCFKYAEQHLQKIFELVQEHEEPSQSQLEGLLDKVKQLNQISFILKNRDIFYESTFLFAHVLSLIKLDSFGDSAVFVKYIKRIMSIIQLCAKFQTTPIAKQPVPELENESLKLSARVPDLMLPINSLYRQMVWILGQAAFRMINVQKLKEEASSSGDSANQSQTAPKISDQQKKNLAIIKESSLLSGGIDPRHLAEVLTQERQKLLKTYLNISEDQFLLDQLEIGKKEQQKEELTDDDRVLRAILNEGVDSQVDLLLKAIQRSFETKMPMVAYARLAGENGFQMTRAAFALIIKFSNMVDDFLSLVDQVQFFQEDESTSKPDIVVLVKSLKEAPQFLSIRNKWEQAAKMRKWISDTKSKLAGKYETELRQEALKKKKEQYLKAKEEAQKASQEEGQIDSSTKPQATSQSQEEADKEKDKYERLTSDESAQVSDDAFTKAENELDAIFKMIKQKSDFLVKLQTPHQFMSKKSKADDNDNQSGDNSQEDKSCVSCVLAILQTPVECNKIQEQVEHIYLNACKRVTGIYIIANLIVLDAPHYITHDIINWFCASLRNSKNKIAHYLDDVRGGGSYLENKSRTYFFQVIKRIVLLLRDASSAKEIKFYLMNALLWKFLGRDHKDLLDLDVFSVLHKGNGQKDNLIKRSWGKYLFSGQVDEQSLSSDLLGYFENLLISILARFVDPSPYDSEQQAKKKKNQLSLQKAKSVINEDTSETLLAQGYDIIFKELDRYVIIMNTMFRGIDWVTYTKAKTSREDLRHFVNEKIKDINLFDEDSDDEEDPASSDKKPDEKKEEVPAEALKREAEEKSKLGTIRQLGQIDKLYQEKFVAKLLALVEMLTSVQSNIASQKLQGHKFQGLLANISSSAYLATLLNLLVLASPSTKFIVLRILQHLIRIQFISFKIFDQAVLLVLEQGNNGDDQQSTGQTEAQLIYSQFCEHSQISKDLESSFLRFLYAYLHSIRSKMWSKLTLESEGSYAVSCEILRTLRLIQEESGDQNKKWSDELDNLVKKVFSNFAQMKQRSPVDLELVLGLVRGCEFQGMMPFSAAIVNEKKNSEQPAEGARKDSGGSQRKKFVQVVGFVQRKWLSRSAEAKENEQRVYTEMKDSSQKVLVVQYDAKDLSDLQFQLHSPQNLTLLCDLSELHKLRQGSLSHKQQEQSNPSNIASSSKESAAADKRRREFKVSADTLDSILRESNILEAGDDQANGSVHQKEKTGKRQYDIHALSQRTSIMKLIHYNLESNPKEFLKVLKSSSLYRQLLRFVCQQSASLESDDEQSGNQITLIDWLEQRCAAIRSYACENQTSLMKYKEVKVQLVQGKLYIQTQGASANASSSGGSKNEFNMSAVQLLSAINYKACEEKKEFKLVLETDVNVSVLDKDEQSPAKKKKRDFFEIEQAVEETEEIVVVHPENLKAAHSKGLEILNQSKAIITYDVDFSELLGLILEKQQGNKDRYARLSGKTVFLVDKEEFQNIMDIMSDKNQQDVVIKDDIEKSEEDKLYEKMIGATSFEESLIESLIKYAGFSRVVAEKIVSKEGTLEEKTLHFSKIVKQIKEGFIDVKELEELRQSEIEQLNQDNSSVKKKRQRKQQIEQKHFDKPEQKCEILQSLKKNFINFVYRSEGDANVDDFNDRHAYFEKVNTFQHNESLHFEYEKILKRLFAMYCRQIFWSLIQNDDIETIFEQILIGQSLTSSNDNSQINSSSDPASSTTDTDKQIIESMRAFSNFIKIIGNECFITNNKRYIANFKAFLKKVVLTCCKKNEAGSTNKYKALLRILLEESIIQCYREHFSEITGEYADFKKPIFEYFQSESRAQLLLNPIVLTEITNLIIEHDKQLIFEHVVDLVSLMASISMYFIGSYELKGKFIEQLLRIVELVRVEYLRQRDSQPAKGCVQITKDTVEQLISLKILQAYFAEFESYHNHGMEEAAHAKRILQDDHSREINGISRRQYERQVYIHRPAIHQKYIDVEHNRQETNKLLIELAYKLRQLSEFPEMDVYFYFQNNMMSYVDLYQRVLGLLNHGDGTHAAKEVKCSQLNKYLTFYYSLDEEQKIYSHQVELKVPEEGFQVQSLEVDFSGDDEAAKQLVEKVLVRIDGDSQFQSHGAAVMVSQDKDGKHMVALYNKTLFKKDQTLQNVFSKGKKFYIHYPVYPDYNYVMSVTSEEPKFDLMERQLFQQFDDFANHDLGTFYLGGNRTKLHSLHSEHLKPYKDHLDIEMISFGKHCMILLLKSGQVYGLGRNKYRHFVDQEQSRNHEREQLIPFFDSKDKILSIESFKRVTVAVTKKGKVYAIGDKLKKILKIKDERFGFFPLPLTEEEANAAAEASKEASASKEAETAEIANNSQADDQMIKKDKTESKLKAKKSWISRCKSSGNFVIYALMENTETQELNIYSIGKNQGGCLLGLGADEQEALYFKKLSFKDPSDGDKKRELKITSVEGVDIRCGQHHTIFGLNHNEHVFVLGCYNRSSQAQEEIISVPTILGICGQYKVQKFDTEKNKTVIVAEKKESGNVQVLVGQFAPLIKEESYKTAQVELDLSGKTTPTRVAQIYVRDNSAYISTTGSFKIDPYNQSSDTVKAGFSAQGIKQSIQLMPQKLAAGAKPVGKSSGITMTLTPDYGFFENQDFIKHKQTEWDKFNTAIDEYKKVHAEAPEEIADFEKKVEAFCDSWLKDSSFYELMTYWKNIKTANDLDSTRLKLKDNQQNNEQISFECKKYNIGLCSTYASYIWGSLSYISRSVDSQDVAKSMPLLQKFLAHRRHVPWSVMNKMLKQYLGTLRTDGESIAIHIVRKKAQDFAQTGQVDLKGEHTIFAQVMKRLEAARYLGLRINNSDKKAWFVKYINEQAIDDGGLFRDCLSEMCAELRHQVQTKPQILCLLPLLVPTKNNQENIGQDREMLVLNPGATTDIQLKMMQYLGALMGMSFRSGILLDLNISRFTWKQIVGEEVTKEDLRLVDEHFVRQLEDVASKAKSMPDKEFAEEFKDYTMSVILSNDEVVDLVPKGRTVSLTRDKAESYCAKALNVRLEESKLQIAALVEGIKETFDRNFLRIISWQFLEYRIMGLNEISIERLKEISGYSNCTVEHEVVKRFWQVLEGFTNEERIGYLRFVWGRTRLPLKEEENVENHMIELNEHWSTSMLPVGRTCFFRLQLPPYETVRKLKAKLMYSITHCRSIDADYDRAGAMNEEEQPSAQEAQAAAHESEDSDVGRPPRFRIPGLEDHDYSSGGDQDSAHEEAEHDRMGGGAEEEE